jgi:hypothetical protein
LEEPVLEEIDSEDSSLKSTPLGSKTCKAMDLSLEAPKVKMRQTGQFLADDLKE